MKGCLLLFLFGAFLMATTTLGKPVTEFKAHGNGLNKGVGKEELLSRPNANKDDVYELMPEVEYRNEDEYKRFKFHRSKPPESVSQPEHAASMKSRTTKSVLKSIHSKKDTFSQNIEDDDIHIKNPRTNRDKFVRANLLESKHDVDDLLGVTTPAPHRTKVSKQQQPKSVEADEITELFNLILQESMADLPVPPVSTFIGPEYFEPYSVDFDLRNILADNARLISQVVDRTTTPPLPQTAGDKVLALAPQSARNTNWDEDRWPTVTFDIKSIVHPEHGVKPQRKIRNPGQVHESQTHPGPVRSKSIPIPIEVIPEKPTNAPKPDDYYSNIVKGIMRDGITSSGGERRNSVPYPNGNEDKGLTFQNVLSFLAFPEALEDVQETPTSSFFENVQSVFESLGKEVLDFPDRVFDIWPWRTSLIGG